MSTQSVRKRILTGDRTTGKLHLGHYVGSHRHRLALQKEYECFFLLADLHMLTTKAAKEDIAVTVDHGRAIVMDHLAIGIDPFKNTFFLQSAVCETYELQLLISSLITVERIQQLPTIKEMASAAGLEQVPYNLLGYPVLMSADIMLARAHLVPVGKDNESHVELTRQITRRFNSAYGETFPVPKPYVMGGTLVGTDGQAKMSKSLNNTIYLSDDEATVNRRVMSMYTDPRRVRADVPGQVTGNPVFVYHDFFNANKQEVTDLKNRYLEGRVGDVEVKEKLARAINNFLSPMRERRAYYENQSGFVDELIHEGTLRVRAEAKDTLLAAKKAMGLTGVWNRISRAAAKRRKTNNLAETAAA